MIEKIPTIFLLVLIILAAGCIKPETSQKPSTTPTGVLTIHFINVGLGDSELIQFPSGKTMLIDAGDSTKGVLVRDYIKKLLCRKPRR